MAVTASMAKRVKRDDRRGHDGLQEGSQRDKR